MSAAEAAAAAFFAQSVAHLLAPPGAEEEAVRCLRAEDLPDLLTHLRARLAPVRAEGETAGRTAERVAVVAMLRGGAHSHRGFGVSLITGELERYADTIEAGAHVGAAGGAA